jgi:SAM-dependent methyltransferase
VHPLPARRRLLTRVERLPSLRTSFDEDAELYDRARPGYPEPLFDELVRLAGLRPGDRALEIGCGTGQATRPQAARGLRVTCVELGENMARVARRNLSAFPGVDVQQGTFEDWALPAESFDVALAATSWHWIEHGVRFVKTAEALRPGGALAIIGTVHVSDERGDAFFRRAQDFYERCAPEQQRGWGDGLPRADSVGPPEFDLGRFHEPVFRRFPWVGTFTAAEYLDLLSSFSDHRRLPAVQRSCLFEGIARVIAEFGGRVRKHHLFTLAVSRRR